MTGNSNVSLNIDEFLNLSKDEFTGKLKETSQQTRAWENEFIHLKEVLKGSSGRIIFEYGIKALSKVIDVVILTKNLIIILEYKNWSTEYDQADIDQTNGYALRLKYFHSTSNDKIIIPILVSTDADYVVYGEHQIDNVLDTSLCNATSLREMLDFLINKYGSDVDNTWEKEWEKGIYKASPTIIRAAENVWNQQNVVGLQQESGISSYETRLSAEDYILEIIEKSKKEGRKSIVFVTGVPGAGKTLVGLNVSIRAQKHGASMLSGNAPLVKVLTEALRRNLDKYYKENKLKPEVAKEYEKIKDLKKQADKDNVKNKLSVEVILRGVYGYKEEIINNRLNWRDKSYTFNASAQKSSQHVVIYDESQRAWTREKMLVPGQRGKLDWQDKESWPFSEPGILLWDMNQLDWGVFICLVGGGQEIHDGEAGICEWLHTICESKDFNDWDIYMAKELTEPQYNQKDSYGKSMTDYNSQLKERIVHCEKLHLTEGQRTTRTGELAPFIDKLVEGTAKRSDYNRIKDKYRIYLTRDVELAKDKLRSLKYDLRNKGDIRIGMLMSSNGKRLRPLGFIDNKETEFLNKTPGWFLDSKEENINSSDFLEVALSEFFVQGLELDIACILWDADFRYSYEDKQWKFHKFGKRCWTEIVDESISGCRSEKTKADKIKKNRKKDLIRFYMRNAYRVLLTRARDGLVICVPTGCDKDDTRLPEFYDDTYNYLKSLGLTELK